HGFAAHNSCPPHPPYPVNAPPEETPAAPIPWPCFPYRLLRTFGRLLHMARFLDRVLRLPHHPAGSRYLDLLAGKKVNSQTTTLYARPLRNLYLSAVAPVIQFVLIHEPTKFVSP